MNFREGEDLVLDADTPQEFVGSGTWRHGRNGATHHISLSPRPGTAISFPRVEESW